MTRFNYSQFLPLALLLFWSLNGCLGCKVSYNFTGGAIKEGIKSVSVERFDNQASLVVPVLSQTLTEKLKDRFQSQTNLELKVANGDIQFSGTITGYDVAPISIQGNETAAQNRLTIRVKVKYENLKYPDDNWDKNFSNFADFSSTQDLSEVESDLIEDITDKISLDIFNKALSNW